MFELMTASFSGSISKIMGLVNEQKESGSAFLPESLRKIYNLHLDFDVVSYFIMCLHEGGGKS